MNRKSTFKDTIQIIRNEQIDHVDEASITSLINVVLFAFGWNVFDPFEVEPQHSLEIGWVDIAVKLFRHRKIFIEIKKSTENLNNHETQLKNYLLNTVDVSCGVLTNAKTWWFYIVLKDENNSSKIIREAEIDINKDSDSEIERVFTNYFLKEKLVEEWYQTNIDIINSDSPNRLSALYHIRIMKDKRIIEPLIKIYKEDNDEMMRSSAFNGLIDLYNELEFNDDILRSVLKIAINDRNQIIKKKTKELLNKMNK